MSLGLAGCEVSRDAIAERGLARVPHDSPRHRVAPNQEIQSDVETCLTGPLSLSEAIHACVLNNLRLKAGREKIAFARADLVTESLIPNTEIFADYQLIPLQSASITKQAGPPQADVLWTIPIDWLVFGKRVAAMKAAKYGVDLAQAEQEDLMRQKISETVVGFYELLEAQEMVRFLDADLQGMNQLLAGVKKQRGGGQATGIDEDRYQLVTLEVERDLRKWRTAERTARAKLRPLLGPACVGQDWHIVGTLDIQSAAPVLPLEEALALAAKSRPDLQADMHAIQQTEAGILRERKKAYPVMSIIPGYNFQHQQSITGFPDAHLATIALNTTLPYTNLNQGNIAKAEAQARQARLNLHARQAEVRAEVEQALVEYEGALALVRTDNPQAIKTARGLRDRVAAGFKAGDRDLLDLLESERLLREHEREAIGHRARYWQALHKLHAAIGTPAKE